MEERTVSSIYGYGEWTWECHTTERNEIVVSKNGSRQKLFVTYNALKLPIRSSPLPFEQLVTPMGQSMSYLEDNDLMPDREGKRRNWMMSTTAVNISVLESYFMHDIKMIALIMDAYGKDVCLAWNLARHIVNVSVGKN